MNAKTPKRQGKTGEQRAGAFSLSLVFSSWRLGVLALVLFLSGTPVLAGDAKPPSKEYLLHLPGIAGYHWMDRQLLSGLRAGGYSGDVDVRDWPGDAAGLAALF